VVRWEKKIVHFPEKNLRSVFFKKKFHLLQLEIICLDDDLDAEPKDDKVSQDLSFMRTDDLSSVNESLFDHVNVHQKIKSAG
jgi:hypothetical protein